MILDRFKLDGRVAIDAPAEGATVSNGFTIAGWAADLSAPSGTGIDSVQAYAYPSGGGAGVYLGAASYGLARPDVGGIFGSRFTNSGYSMTVANLTPGAVVSTPKKAGSSLSAT